MASFLLVHGGFHGAWCWASIIPEIEKLGHDARAVELPGRGDDKTPHSEITLDLWTKHVVEQASSGGRPPILVGHSLGGLTITRAAELSPNAFDSLIYLTAAVPPQGEAAISRSALSQVPYMHIINDGQTLTVTEEILPLLYNSCSADDIAKSAARLCPEPITPMTTPVTTTEGGFGRARRSYIHCTLDRMMPLAWQHEIAERLGCTRTITMESDHSPFLCAPQALARNLASLA